MPAFVSPIISPNISIGSENSGWQGSIDISALGAGELKVGVSIQLTIQGSWSEALTSGGLEINNNLFKLPLQIASSTTPAPLEFPENRPYQAEVRIISLQGDKATFKLVSIEGKRPEDFVKVNELPRGLPQDEIVKPHASATLAGSDIKSEVEIYNFGLKKLNPQFLKTLPSQTAEIIKASLQKGEISVGFKRVLPSSILPAGAEFAQQEILSSHDKVLNLLSDAFKSFGAGKISQALETIKQAQGQSLFALTQNYKNTTVTGFKTALGEFVSPSNLKLSDNVPVELIIKSIQIPAEDVKNIIEHLRSETNPLQLLEDLGQQNSHEASPLQTRKIENLLPELKIRNTAPDIYETILQKIPTAGKTLMSNIVNYMKAIKYHDVHFWLGSEIVEKLAQSGVDGQEALQQLSSACSNAIRETTFWKIIEIPFYTGENIEKIRLSIKKSTDEEQKEAKAHSRPQGTRFLVDTVFSMLGKIQFDGYSHAKEKRFDLIIRTEKTISKDICSEIMRIFKTSLHDLSYYGTINVNVKENFIKIGEDKPEEKLGSGILI